MICRVRKIVGICIMVSILGTGICRSADGKWAELAKDETKLPVIDVRKYAASGSGTLSDPWVDALRNAYKKYGNFHKYYLPEGYYKDKTTCDLKAERVVIEGAGLQATTWYYENTDGSPCLRLSSKGGKAPLMPANVIRNIGFEGNDKAAGAAIEYIEQYYFLVENVDIRHFRAAAEKGTSKGIISKGRAFCRFRNVTAGQTTIPFSIEDDPYCWLDCDLYSFENVTFHCMDVEHGIGLKIDNVCMLSMRFSGSNVIEYGKYGIYWAGKREKGGISRDIKFSNIRFEGGKVDYAIYVDLKGRKAEQVKFSDLLIGPKKKACFWLSGISKVAIDNCLMMADDVAIHADETVSPLVIENTTVIKGVGNKNPNPIQIAAPKLFGGINRQDDYGYHFLSYYDNHPKASCFFANLGKRVSNITPADNNIKVGGNDADVYVIDITDIKEKQKNILILNPADHRMKGREISFVIKNSSKDWTGNIKFDNRYMSTKNPLPRPEPGKYTVITFVNIDGQLWLEKSATENVN